MRETELGIHPSDERLARRVNERAHEAEAAGVAGPTRDELADEWLRRQRRPKEDLELAYMLLRNTHNDSITEIQTLKG